jgi:hypothetical protein
MLANFNASARQIFWGNILLAVCCAFYLAWWLLAFKPLNPVKGFKTGWLLIPATVAGLATVFLAIHGVASSKPETKLFSNSAILRDGVIAYVVIMLITSRVFKRPVTTELILIVGWLMLALVEVNVLMGFGLYSHSKAVVFIAIASLATVINLVCYCLYYKLDAVKGFYDGTIPLVLVMLLTLAIDLSAIDFG